MSKCIYNNGSYTVIIDSWGNKEYFGESFNPEFPDSLDLKITDQCHYGCSFCHESSGSLGKHGDLKTLLQKLKGLPKGVELAIGGGNPLLHPGLTDFLLEIKDHFYAALTVNWKDILDPIKNKKLSELIEDGLINSLGVSLADEVIDFSPIASFKENELYKILQNREGKCNIVYHAIIGITPQSTIKSIKENSFYNSWSVLFLGFKSFGRAKKMSLSEDTLKIWKTEVTDIIFGKRLYSFGCVNMAFDNLALEQLDIRSLIPDSLWNQHYMGNEFSHSMYVDAVRGEYGPTSRSDFSERISWDSGSIIDYFKKEHKNHD